MKFQFKISKQDIDKAYQSTLDKLVGQTTIKGFRKGKAPKNLVEDKIGKSEIEKKTIEYLLPLAYQTAVVKHKAKPITYPSIKPVTVEKNGDYVFEAEIIEKPEINLGDYQKALKAAGAKEKIWTPDKGNPSEKPSSQKSPTGQQNTSNQQSDDQSLKIIFDTLLEIVKLEVPEELVKREVDRMLSRLLDQVNKLGLKIEDYLVSLNTNKDKLRQEYTKSAEANLKLEFILQEIAIDQKIDVTDKEIDDLIQNVPDPKIRKNLKSPDEKINIKLMLLKRKTIDKLKTFLAVFSSQGMSPNSGQGIKSYGPPAV